MPIRPRLPEDLPDLVTLATAIHRSDGYPPYMPDDDFLGFVASDEAVAAWVATEDGRVVGHVALHNGSSPGVLDLAASEPGVKRSDCGVVARLLVASKTRRSGVGRRLLDHATADCRRRGLVPILDVVDRFEPAISLYENAGWSRLGAVDVRLPDGTEMREHVYAAPQARDHA